MRKLIVFSLLLLITNSPQAAEVSQAQSLINTFQIMCTLELPNFEHIDAKATAMRMQLQADSKEALPGNAVTHSKAWAGNLTSGPFGLLLDEMSGPKGKATACAIVGDVPDLEAFRSEVVNAIKLQNVPPPEIRSDGSRSFIWDGIYAPGTTLIIRDFKPSGKSSVMLKLLTMDDGRGNATAAMFNNYCLNKLSDFAELDHRATEAHYEVVVDRSIPMPNGQVMRQKNWLIPFPGGAPKMLASNDVTNGSLHVFICGIYAPDLNGAIIEPALSALPQLGSPTKHFQGAGGSTVTWWFARIGESSPSDDSQVMLSRDVPGIPGVNINLIYKTHLDHKSK